MIDLFCDHFFNYLKIKLKRQKYKLQSDIIQYIMKKNYALPTRPHLPMSQNIQQIQRKENDKGHLKRIFSEPVRGYHLTSESSKAPLILDVEMSK